MRTRRIRLLCAAAVALLMGLTACASEPELNPAAGERLQEVVGDVVRAAAEGDYESALVAVARTRAVLEESADAGLLSAARYRLIDDALTRTEAELGEILEAIAAEAAAEAGSDEESDDSDGGSGSTESGGRGPPAHSNEGGKGSD